MAMALVTSPRIILPTTIAVGAGLAGWFHIQRRAISTADLRVRHQAALNDAAGRTAVVMGATSGIGEGCALRLASAGFNVVAVGRDLNRGAAVVEKMRAQGKGSHEFVPCDAFLLTNIAECAAQIRSRHSTVDVLVLSQGMGSLQGFTPTAEGNDQKLTLHYWGRAAMTVELLPLLRQSPDARVISILAAGVHPPYAAFREDPELKRGYSVKNSADFGCFYNDLGFDAIAQQPENKGVTFVHASPGFVNTNWGTEMPWPVRAVIRVIQKFGRTPADCAESMLHPVFVPSAVLRVELGAAAKDGRPEVLLMGPHAEPAKCTALHTPENCAFVWDATKAVLQRAGIPSADACSK